ncbi:MULTISPECIES: FecCD family ABC transporter permease [unclassified Arthrobacter]|uniref:FecCD family ABC transporter permease n=1 Tax=unclassified Arthrobacter TaxID=235627 RepID=UPI002E034A85|nr:MULTISPECIES: iron chelate uptake ABC transporter family permease subunit [unclassified Arthrobacter]MEC5190658.1 iron complex transport system permease protein [Arthrobacter sp. MP_M4]MEC5202742.1 iron complex transport system permease protein [Arthrobacter sp. MP_M7]
MVPTRTALLALAAAGLFAACVLLGSYTVTVPDFLRILAAHVTGGEKIPGASFIVMEHKLPRALVGTLIGAAFGLSGALFQTMLRNPLASPDVIGISYGASAAAVTAMVVFGASGAAVAGAAFAGALGVAGLIYSISRSGSFGSGGRRGDAADSSLILAGVGIAAALHAVVSFLLTRADIRTAADVLIWLNGSLNSATWDRAGVLGLALTALVPAVLVLAGPLRILELGDDTAAGLGVRVGAVRLGIVVTAVGLAAAATAAAGPVSFVAFLAGPIARRFVRTSSLPASAFAGVVIVLGADYIAANIAPLLLDGTVLPVGVVTGALGAPFLLWQLATSTRKDT